jgi:hypothetical protein
VRRVRRSRRARGGRGLNTVAARERQLSWLLAGAAAGYIATLFLPWWSGYPDYPGGTHGWGYELAALSGVSAALLLSWQVVALVSRRSVAVWPTLLLACTTILLGVWALLLTVAQADAFDIFRGLHLLYGGWLAVGALVALAFASVLVLRVRSPSQPRQPLWSMGRPGLLVFGVLGYLASLFFSWYGFPVGRVNGEAHLFPVLGWGLHSAEIGGLVATVFVVWQLLSLSARAGMPTLPQSVAVALAGGCVLLGGAALVQVWEGQGDVVVTSGGWAAVGILSTFGSVVVIELWRSLSRPPTESSEGS